MATSLSLLKTENINPADYFNPLITERRWELSYGTKDKFYLTDEEKERFMNQIKKGSSIIEIGGNFLTAKFIYLIAIKPKPKDRKFEEYMDDQGNIKYREVS